MYLIWTVLNAAFVILFFALVLSLIVKGKKLFENDYGNLILILLAIGVLGILNKDATSPKNEYIFPTNEMLVGRSVKTSHINIEDNLTFDIGLTIRFRKDATGELIPSFSRSHATGYTNGLVWNYNYADIEKLKDNTFSYTVVGTLDWRMYGIKIYTQPKEFKGTFEL